MFIWVGILSVWRRSDVHHTGTSLLAALVSVYLSIFISYPHSDQHALNTRHSLSRPTKVIPILGTFCCLFPEYSPPDHQLAGSPLKFTSELTYHFHEIQIIYIPQLLPHTLVPVFVCHVISFNILHFTYPLFEMIIFTFLFVPCVFLSSLLWKICEIKGFIYVVLCCISSTLRSSWHTVGIQQIFVE